MAESKRTVPLMMIPRPNVFQEHAKRMIRMAFRQAQSRLSGYQLEYQEAVEADKVTAVIVVKWPEGKELIAHGNQKELQDIPKSR